MLLSVRMIIVGVDEVGRGCWAGPVVAGAVILRTPIDGLKDSKKLLAKRRSELSAQIISSADYGLGWVSPSEVDQLGLTAAVGLAMQRAVDKISDEHDVIVIDGDYNFLPNNRKTQTLIKADDLIPAVSAASIIAKVARDNYIAEQAVIFPEYGFDSHVGYGTKKHIQALDNNGVTPIHRLSYKPIKAYL